jgi:uncharacterized protein YfkK (UPF0435 family)
MKNKLAQKLADRAEKYRSVERTYPDAAKIVQSDYEDLMSIANMIENNEDGKAIAKAMWKLDTAVRDEIPDEVYYHFNK